MCFMSRAGVDVECVGVDMVTLSAAPLPIRCFSSNVERLGAPVETTRAEERRHGRVASPAPLSSPMVGGPIAALASNSRRRTIRISGIACVVLCNQASLQLPLLENIRVGAAHQ